MTRTVADELLTLLSEHGLAARMADRHVRTGSDGYSADDIERIARTLAQRNDGRSGSVESLV